MKISERKNIRDTFKINQMDSCQAAPRIKKDPRSLWVKKEKKIVAVIVSGLSSAV